MKAVFSALLLHTTLRKRLLRVLRGGMLCIGIVGLFSSATVFAEDTLLPESQADTEFEQCIVRLQTQARESGLQESSIALLDDVRPIRRTITLDRNQPEFVQTFSGYYFQRVNNIRVKKGREMLRKHSAFLNDLLKEYGVPPQYLVSFWALESNFGRNVGKMSTLDTLATLACDQRRSAYFSNELIAALKVIEQFEIDHQRFEGSWAGAVGQTQFMPSVFLRYGIDGDGDGDVDLWRSEKDALRSAANYLNQIGWQRELRWGREVRLPQGFQYHLAGLNSPQNLSHWKALGVTKTNGDPIQDADISASLLVPSGAEGPAFLVYDNFHVILEWNRSQFYALAVGILADRINGAGNLYAEPPTHKAVTKDQVVALQEKLKLLGYDPGEVDGRLGPATAAAIRQYQFATNRVADGFVDRELLSQLELN